MRLLLLLLVVPAIVHAQPARVCQGKPTGEDLTTCGQFFLDAYQRDPSAPDGDQHLYNAGVMFAEGHSIGAAIQSFTLLRRSFPNSKLGPRALGRLANLYAQVVMIDKAAEALEQYARLYAGEKDAYDALSDAIYYRRALGDDAKVIEQTKLFMRLYGAKKRAESAAAMFALTAVFERRGDRDATIKHLREYIRMFGEQGGRDRLVIAHAKIGELVWQQSCPVKPIDGECVRVKRAPVCEGARSVVERVKRDDRMVKEALAAFASAIKAYEVVAGRTGGDEGGARYFYARALLARVDVEAEARPVPPRGRDLAAWVNAEVAARGRLVEKYENVVAAKDVATAIVATSRIARLSDDLASAIVATAKPAECKALAATAAPFRENAALRYGVCLAKASETAWFDDAARSCEVALARLAPDEFPPLRERLGAASRTVLLVVSDPRSP